MGEVYWSWGVFRYYAKIWINFAAESFQQMSFLSLWVLVLLCCVIVMCGHHKLCFCKKKKKSKEIVGKKTMKSTNEKQKIVHIRRGGKKS